MNIDLLRLKVSEIAKIEPPKLLTMSEWLRQCAIKVTETKTGYRISINEDEPKYMSILKGNQ